MVRFGSFLLPVKQGVSSTIQYNQNDINLLGDSHEYTIELSSGSIEISCQLYENTNNHYRLFLYIKSATENGMAFSINLTTEKESDNIIFLTQKIKFSDQLQGDAEIAKSIRRAKQIVMTGLLDQLGFDVSDNSDVTLGIFDPRHQKFVNTSNEQFINDFIAIGLIKGHYQGNKGYVLDIIPSSSYSNNENSEDVSVDDEVLISSKLTKLRDNRYIPSGMRYFVLKRDNFLCVKCGYGPVDGRKLHADHKLPHSLGGKTTLDNLWTLCQTCNIGKGNRHKD
jgi:hypothetical protein